MPAKTSSSIAPEQGRWVGTATSVGVHDTVPVRRFATGAALGVVLLAYVCAERGAFNPALGDEALYWFQALRTTQGLTPYRDFFHAHPPMHLAFAAAALWVSQGFSLFAAKLPALLGGAVQIAGVFGFALRLCADRRHALVAASVASFVLATSYLLLTTAGHDVGVAQAAALLVVATWLLAAGRARRAGAALGLAAMTSFVALPAAATLAILAGSWLRTRRERIGFTLSAGGVTAATNAWGYLTAGDRYVSQVFGYHLAKQATGSDRLGKLCDLLVTDWPLVTLGALGAVALSLSTSRHRRQLLAISSVALVQILACAAPANAFPYYVAPAFPALALLAGLGAARIVAAMRNDAPVPHAGHLTADRALTFALLGVAVAGLPLVLSANSPRASRLAVGRFVVDGVGAFEAATPMADLARLLATGRQDAVLFGDSAVVPLTALATGIPILADDADTNAQRFDARPPDLDVLLARLAAAPHPIVILSEQLGVGTFPAVRQWVHQACVAVRTFESRSGDVHTMYVRRGERSE